tara:strand:+ start:1105 stop:1668 length:564 start_codon:yes stop_codon:yes gene_type:complete
MASTLKINNLDSATGSTITVASGKSLVAPGHVINVQSVTMTDSTTFAGTAFTDVTDGNNPLSITITPKNANSKFLLIMNVSASADNGSSRFGFRFLRNSTAVGVGDTQGSRISVAVAGIGSSSNANDETLSFTHLDSPSTSSAITYKVQGQVEQSGSNLIINRSSTNANSNTVYRTASSFTVMEIAQ